jgi:hypothetical protein
MSSWCPPLFDEVPRRVTKRLFLYASDGIAEMLRQKYKIRGYVTEDYEYMVHMAWLIGGTSAAQALIREVDAVKKAWGKGDDQKTLSLTKVCSAHMISVWFRTIEVQPELPADARRVSLESAASSMLSVISKFLCTRDAEVSAMTAQDVKDFMSMDAQWNRENDSGGQPLTYAGLLLGKAIEACGQRCVQSAVLTPHPFEDSETLTAVLTCLDEGVRSVKRYYQMNIEGKVQLPVRH